MLGNFELIGLVGLLDSCISVEDESFLRHLNANALNYRRDIAGTLNKGQTAKAPQCYHFINLHDHSA